MNPYDPAIPATPERFAGRARLIDRTASLLEKARVSRTSSAILLYGHRGSGKTSALRKVEALVAAWDSHAIRIEVPLRQRRGEAALLMDIADELQRFLDQAKEADSFFRRVHARLSSVSMSVLGTGFAVTKSEHRAASNPFTGFRKVLSAAAEAPLVLIAVDDAELLDDVGLGTLKTITEAALGLPILLVVAGGPELWTRLSLRGGSPVARIFSGSTFDMSDFTLEETRIALEAPVRRSRVKWSPAAIERVQALSHGYPYLVQCLAESSFQEGGISAADVDRGVPAAVELASPWLEHEIGSASDEDVRAFVRIAGLGRTTFRTTEILRAGVLPPYIPRLVRLGVLAPVRRGVYALRKAPVIAYFQALRRQID